MCSVAQLSAGRAGTDMTSLTTHYDFAYFGKELGSNYFNNSWTFSWRLKWKDSL